MKTTTERNLKCVLVQSEMLDYSKKLARSQQDKIGVEEQKKEVMDQIKGRLSALECEIGKLSRSINNGYEYRDVECQWEYDWKKKTKKLIRLDTEDVVEVREIEDWEKQKNLDLDNKEKGSKK